MLRLAKLCIWAMLAAALTLWSLKNVSAVDNAEPPKGHPDSSQWADLFAPDLSNAIFPAGVWSWQDGVLTATEDQCI
ncbi:MAG: hypothetical protein H5U08_17305, partial [Thermogutta sp.]|uniref:hypothetical protein n=1 Tax=Thermogutta sp. TaxID=1962930 RepID=UPI0019BB324E